MNTRFEPGSTPDIETTVDEFVHTGNGSRITLCGTVHAAETDYFQQLVDIIEDREKAGAVVHYEAVRDLKEREPSLLDRPKIRALGKMGAMGQLIAVITGLRDQGDVIIRQPQWENHDVTLLDLAHRMTFKQAMEAQASAAVLENFSRIMPRPVLGIIMLRGLAYATADGGSSGPILGMDNLIVDYRNTVALDAVRMQQTQDPGSHITLLWGQGHIPGLGDGLIGQDYVQKGREQIRAVNVADKMEGLEAQFDQERDPDSFMGRIWHEFV